MSKKSEDGLDPDPSSSPKPFASAAARDAGQITKPASSKRSETLSASASTKKMAFVHKLYAMLSDPKLSHLLWWTRDDADGTFALNPCSEFSKVLTHYFKHGNVSSFVRQLHMYGFHKVSDKAGSSSSFESSDQENNTTNKQARRKENAKHNASENVWEFRHASGMFRKGDEESLSAIKRRQPASSARNSSVHHAVHTELAPRSQGYQEVPINSMMQQQISPEAYYSPSHSFPMAQPSSVYYQPYPSFSHNNPNQVAASNNRPPMFAQHQQHNQDQINVGQKEPQRALQGQQQQQQQQQQEQQQQQHHHYRHHQQPPQQQQHLFYQQDPRGSVHQLHSKHASLEVEKSRLPHHHIHYQQSQQHIAQHLPRLQTQPQHPLALSMSQHLQPQQQQGQSYHSQQTIEIQPNARTASRLPQSARQSFDSQKQKQLTQTLSGLAQALASSASQSSSSATAGASQLYQPAATAYPESIAQNYRNSLNEATEISRHLGASQHALSRTSSQLSHEVTNTTADVLRFSDSLPKFEPLIQKLGEENYQRIQDLKSSFRNRAGTLQAHQSVHQQRVLPSHPFTSLSLTPVNITPSGVLPHPPASAPPPDATHHAETRSRSPQEFCHQFTPYSPVATQQDPFNAQHRHQHPDHSAHSYHFQPQPQLPFAMPRYDSNSSIEKADNGKQSERRDPNDDGDDNNNGDDTGSPRIRTASLIDPLARVPPSHFHTSSVHESVKSSQLSDDGQQPRHYNPLTERNPSIFSIPKLSSLRLDQRNPLGSINNEPSSASSSLIGGSLNLETSVSTSSKSSGQISPSGIGPTSATNYSPKVQPLLPSSPKQGSHFFDNPLVNQRHPPRSLPDAYQFRNSDSGAHRGSYLPVASDSQNKKASFGHFSPHFTSASLQIRKSILALHRVESHSNPSSSVDLSNDGSSPLKVSSLSSTSSGGSFSPSSSISSIGSIRTSTGSVSSISHLLNLTTSFKPVVKSSLSKEPEIVVDSSLEGESAAHPCTNSLSGVHLGPGELNNNKDCSSLSTIGEGTPNSQVSIHDSESKTSSVPKNSYFRVQQSDEEAVDSTKKMSVSSLLDDFPAKNKQSKPIHIVRENVSNTEGEDLISRKRVHSGSSSEESSGEMLPEKDNDVTMRNVDDKNKNKRSDLKQEGVPKMSISYLTNIKSDFEHNAGADVPKDKTTRDVEHGDDANEAHA